MTIIDQPYPYSRITSDSVETWSREWLLSGVPLDGQMYCVQNGVWVLNPVQLVAGETNKYNLINNGGFDSSIFDTTDLTIDAGTF